MAPVIRHEDRDWEPLPGSEGAVRLMVDPRAGAHHILQRIFRFGVGETPELVNEASEEIIFVAEGKGEARLGVGETEELLPGIGLFVPIGLTHRFVNPGPHDLTLVSVLSPPPAPAPVSGNPPEAVTRFTVRESEEELLPAGPGRSFKVLVDPRIGCRTATQFVGFIERGRAPAHTHPYEEAIYILEGEGIAHIHDRADPVATGDSIFLAPGTPHTIENAATGTLRLLGVFSPPGSPAGSVQDLAEPRA